MLLKENAKKKKIGMTLMRGYPYFLTDMKVRKNRRTHHSYDRLVYVL